MKDFVVSKVVYPQVRAAGKEKSKASFDEAIALLGKYVEDEKDRMDLAESFELSFLQISEDWEAYTMKADAKLKDKPLEDQLGFANGVAWTLYEKCDDPKCLKMMEKWMDKVVELDPSYAYLDTYAALLFKNGELDSAKKYALKAIEAGKEDESDTKETEALLEKIEGERGE